MDSDAVRTRLVADLRAECESEQADWDEHVARDDAPGSDLWGSMPTVDSKTIARMSPTFEKHLGRPLDVRLIRRGGYDSIDEAIEDLVPKMMGAVPSSKRAGTRGRRLSDERGPRHPSHP